MCKLGNYKFQSSLALAFQSLGSLCVLNFALACAYCCPSDFIVPAFHCLLPSPSQPVASRAYKRLQRLGMTGKGAKTEKEEEKEKAEWLRKYIESSWKLTIFSTFTITAFLVSYGEKWFTDTR